ncbi:MAG: T9SS type A sorting domain-containing protein [Bacteroidetes bacterium]|nr:T9SS type A sorting domain-containing protein [Bacteroidota bacterium]
MRFVYQISIIINVLTLYNVQAQGDGINLQKYWYYKTRFNNDFIKIGKNLGESVPFNQRGSTQTGYPSSTNNQQTLKTGDAVSSIGIHLAALATEYALLKNANQNTDSVKHEIFCALNAINRIDHISEPMWYWAGGTTVPLNGFLIRDDIPVDFVAKNYGHFNYYNNGYNYNSSTGDANPNSQLNDRGFCTLQTIGQALVESSYQDLTKSGSTESPDNETLSHDHYITLLTGLALINKLVDYSATDNGEIFPYENLGVSSLKQEAWNITDRFAQHFKNDVFFDYRNPVTGQIVQPGGSSIALGYGIAEASCISAGNTSFPINPYIPLISSTSINPKTCNYVTPYVNTVLFSNWLGFIGVPSTSVDNAVFKVDLLAVGNCGWQAGQVSGLSYICNQIQTQVCSNAPWPLNYLCNIVTSIVCGNSIVMLPGFHNKTSNFIDLAGQDPYSPQEALKENTPRHYDLWHAPLLHRVLFPTQNTSYSAYLPKIKTMLDNAPCEGPYNFGQFARPNFEWTCENRIEKTINRYDWNEPTFGWHGSSGSDPLAKTGQKGEYNGTDYMLYHNLYWLNASNVGSANYINLSHRYINVPFPNPNANHCIKPSTCLIRAFETITADNTINSNADVSYKAGKVIVLKPGFNVVSGADFHAYIQRADCSSGASGLRTAVTDSTKGPENTFYGYDDMGDNIVTHYVDYSNIKDSVREDILSFLNPNNTETQEMPILPPEEINYDKINSFNVYPNPADNFSTVEFSLQEKENAQLVILNNLGQIVAADVVSDINTYRKTFYTADLAKGIYLIKIITSTNRLLIKKLTIQ